MGAQRSGTTLLRLILNAHSEIAIPEEATFLLPLLDKTKINKAITPPELQSIVNYLASDKQFKLWNYDSSIFLSQLQIKDKINPKELIEMIFSSYATGRNKTVWGDKTPSFFNKVNVLFELFPNAKFIHIVRDGRDVFDSHRKINPDPLMNDAVVAALEWSYKLYNIEKSLKRIPMAQKLTIRYEDLLDRPEETVRSICSLINIEYEPSMFKFYETSNQYIGRHHSKLIFQPIRKDNKNKWKENLSPYEAKVFNVAGRFYLRKFNYDLSIDRYSLNDILFILKSLILKMPLRLISVIRGREMAKSAIKIGKATEYTAVGSMPSKAGK